MLLKWDLTVLSIIKSEIFSIVNSFHSGLVAYNIAVIRQGINDAFNIRAIVREEFAEKARKERIRQPPQEGPQA